MATTTVSKGAVHDSKGFGPDGLASWFTSRSWAERIVTFSGAWFVATMGTGVCVQVLTNIPYPAYWLHNLAYCFLIADIAIFLFFTFLAITRLILHPRLCRTTVFDFAQAGFLGAVPISLDNIIIGILIFYADRQAAVWACYGLWWVCVVMSLIVCLGVMFVAFAYQDPHPLDNITGSTLLYFIPCIVTSAAGSRLLPYLPSQVSLLTLTVSFLLWALGVTVCLALLCLYLARLLRHSLPARDAIASSFIPLGPTGMGAYSIQNLAVGLSRHIVSQEFALSRSSLRAPAPFPVYDGNLETVDALPDSSLIAVAEAVHWIGTLAALLLLAYATFWLVLALLSVLSRPPKRFSIALWGSVFPVGVYANGLCTLSLDLRNTGFKVYGAAMVVLCVLFWCICAGWSFYDGVWRARLVLPTGLEGRVVKAYLEDMRDGGGRVDGNEEDIMRTHKRKMDVEGTAGGVGVGVGHDEGGLVPHGCGSGSSVGGSTQGGEV